MNTDKRIFLVAGGTGGHIWPAISFGKWLEQNVPNIKVDYICGSRPLEKEIYSAAECEPFILPMLGSPLTGSIKEKGKRLKALLKSFFDAKGIIKRTSPDFILLFGGYVSFPVLLAARHAKIPVAVQEQNAYAGKVTRYAAAKKVPVYSGWSECLPLKNNSYMRTGVPVRKFRVLRQEDAWKKLGLADEFPSGKKVVVMTGSLGSRSVKDQICSLAAKEPFCKWTFLFPAVAEKIEKVSDNVYLLPKVWETEKLFSVADMVIVRAGGSSLTEIGTLGIPALIIPWEKAVDNHQFHNAVAFAAENTALLWNGKCEKELSQKMLKLEKLSEKKEQIMSSQLYNNSDRICAGLWAEISSRC